MKKGFQNNTSLLSSIRQPIGGKQVCLVQYILTFQKIAMKVLQHSHVERTKHIA